MIKINVQAAVQLAGSEAKNGSSIIQGKKETKTGNAFTALLNLLAQGQEDNLKEYYAGDNRENKEGKNSDLNVVTMLDTLFTGQTMDGQQLENVVQLAGIDTSKSSENTIDRLISLFNQLAQGNEGNIKELYNSVNLENKEDKENDLNIIKILDNLFANQAIDQQQMETINYEKINELLQLAGIDTSKSNESTNDRLISLLNQLAQGNEGNIKELYNSVNLENKEDKESNLNAVTLLDSLFTNQEGQQVETSIYSDEKIQEILTSMTELPELSSILEKMDLKEEEKELLKLFSDFAKETLEKINSGEDIALLAEKTVLQLFEQAFLNNQNIHRNGYIEKGEINFKRFFEELNQRLEQQNNLTRTEKAEVRKVFRAMQEMASLQRDYNTEKQQFRQENLNLRPGHDGTRSIALTRQAGNTPVSDNSSNSNTPLGSNRNQGETQKPVNNSNYTNLQQPAKQSNNEVNIAQASSKNMSEPKQNTYVNFQQINRQFSESNAGNQAQANSPANRAPVTPPLEGNINSKGLETRPNTLNSEGQAKTIVATNESSGNKQEGFSGNQQGFASTGKTATISLQGQQGNNLPQAAQMAAKVAPVIQQAVSNGQGATTLHIKLRPESLGEVTVRITYNQGNIQAHFIAATAHTREMLDQSMTQLRENLSQMNINLSDASTSSSGQEGQKWSQQDQFKNEKNNTTPGDEFFLPGEHEDELNEDEMDSGERGLNYLV